MRARKDEAATRSICRKLTDGKHADAGDEEHNNVVGLAPPLGPGVHDNGDHSFQEGELSSEAQGEQHGEEQQGPDLGTGEKGDGLGVDDKSQARS